MCSDAFCYGVRVSKSWSADTNMMVIGQGWVSMTIEGMGQGWVLMTIEGMG